MDKNTTNFYDVFSDTENTFFILLEYDTIRQLSLDYPEEGQQEQFMTENLFMVLRAKFRYTLDSNHTLNSV